MKANYMSKIKFFFCAFFVACLLSCKPSNPERLTNAKVLTYTLDLKRFAKMAMDYEFGQSIDDEFLGLMFKNFELLDEESKKRTGKHLPFSMRKEDKEGYIIFTLVFNATVKEYFPPYIIGTPINPTIEDAQKMQAIRTLYSDDEILDFKIQSDSIVETALYRINEISLLDTKMIARDFKDYLECTFSLKDLELVK